MICSVYFRGRHPWVYLCSSVNVANETFDAGVLRKLLSGRREVKVASLNTLKSLLEVRLNGYQKPFRHVPMGNGGGELTGSHGVFVQSSLFCQHKAFPRDSSAFCMKGLRGSPPPPSPPPSSHGSSFN